MPELPEVEHLRRTLARVLPGRAVTGAILHRTDICEPVDGERAGPTDLLLGGRLVEPIRHGKQLALVVDDGRALRVHLGMTGQLVVHAPGSPAPRSDHVHAEWALDDGARLTFRDPRRFGGLAPYRTLDSLRRSWTLLGPDAASIRDAALLKGLSETTRAVKAALLDQRLIAGVGNIYADEALFRAGINPWRRADRLTAPQAQALARAIRSILAGAVRAGGSSLRDYVDGNGRPGRHQLAHRVYGRGGEACLACGAVLRSLQLAQRTTVYCARCQPGGARRRKSTRFSTIRGADGRAGSTDRGRGRRES